MYAGDDGFVEGVGAFLREGLDAGEAALVVVSARKIGLLSDALGSGRDGVFFADMAEVGSNPNRIIPAWYEFVESQAGGAPFRGVGEPISPERSADELTECQRHEALLNLAFDDGPSWRLMCPYDTSALSPHVIDEMWRSHRYVAHDGTEVTSSRYADPPSHFDLPLPDPPRSAAPLDFDADRVDLVRRRVAEEALQVGMSGSEIEDFVLAVHELAANSVRHGGGGGLLRVWHQDGRIVADVRDRGYLDQPLAGRRRPETHRTNGRGLWLVNHLCDLVQIRSSETGTVVRVHKAPAGG